MSPRTRILYHGPRPRPVHLRPLRRIGVASLLERLCLAESEQAAASGTYDDVDHLCDLADRAGSIAWETP
jgi:hypothetical protein